MSQQILKSIAVTLAVMVFGLLAGFGLGHSRFIAHEDPHGRLVSLDTNDLASILGVKGWKFEIDLVDPVLEVGVVPVEARRGPNGDWQVERLGPGLSFHRPEEPFSSVTIAFLTREDQQQKYVLRIDNQYFDASFTKVPNYDSMTRQLGYGLVDGTREKIIVLAWRTDQRELFEHTHVIGLQLEFPDE